VYIPRHIAKVIVRQSKRKPVIILTGPRQAGKSTLLKILLQNKRVKYVLLDNPTVREIAIENPSRFLEMHRAPVVLDEVQKAPKLFEYIKEIVDAHSEK
jgi:predicted AAA+ superfamily ATPase